LLKDRIDQYFENREDDFVQAITRLVAAKSVREPAQPGMPFGEGPAKALATGLALANELGFKTTNFDNYVGTVDLNENETKLGILCHLDVVGEGIGWSMDPYTVVVKDGLAFGRGTSDNKGPAVAALFALKAIKDLNIPLKYNARLILGTDEESGSGDIKYYFERQPAPQYTFSPDGAFPVTNVEKGGFKPTFTKHWKTSTALPRVTAAKGGYRVNVVPPQADAWVEGMSISELEPFCRKAEAATGTQISMVPENGAVKITVLGKGGHAAAPESSVNAVTAMLALLASLPLARSDSAVAIQAIHELLPHGDFYGRALGISQSDDLSGPLTASFDIFELNLTGCSGIFDSRVPLCATKATVDDVVRAKLAAHGFDVDGQSFPGHHTPAESEFVKTLLAVYESYTGLPGGCESTGGGTYVHSIEGGVCFGAILPDFEANMHCADERVRISDMITASKIFTQVIADLCG
jgi:succinyl-diaminopimelate desuccinylase